MDYSRISIIDPITAHTHTHRCSNDHIEHSHFDRSVRIVCFSVYERVYFSFSHNVTYVVDSEAHFL